MHGHDGTYERRDSTHRSYKRAPMNDDVQGEAQDVKCGACTITSQNPQTCVRVDHAEHDQLEDHVHYRKHDDGSNHLEIRVVVSELRCFVLLTRHGQVSDGEALLLERIHFSDVLLREDGLEATTDVNVSGRADHSLGCA